MEMLSIRLYLALTLFTATYQTSAAISPGCTSNIEILKNDSVAQQLESYLKNDMDIIEVHVKPNTCIALTNDGNTISNKAFASASSIEKYNMFIYFIVTDTGRALMQYPADADTLSFGVLGSRKVLIDVDVMFDNNDCALNPERLRTKSLKALSALAQIRNINDISICYYKVLEYSCWYYLLLLVSPYHTYNTFNTFCLTGGVTTGLPQAIPNKILYWLCIVLHMTLPVGFFFIPHSVHKRTDSYRKCDVPFSVSMLLSYVTYWKLASRCGCCGERKYNQQGDDTYSDSKLVLECCDIMKCCRPLACCGCCTDKQNKRSASCAKSNGKDTFCIREWFTPLERLFICITFLSFVSGLFIHFVLNRKTNTLENDLMIHTGSSAFFYFYKFELVFTVTIIIIFVITAVYRLCLNHSSNENTTEISYPIYILLVEKKDSKKSCSCENWSFNCDNVFNLKLKTDRADFNTTIKMVSEVIFNAKLWWYLFKASVCIVCVINAPVVLICCLPYINNCISSLVNDFKETDSTIAKFNIFSNHFFRLLFVIVIVNITLIQTTTLVLQVIVLCLFVGIPVYPKLLAYIILLTGFIKYIMQAFLRFQSQTKHVLDEMFNSDEYKDKEEIPKTLFATVLRQCSSVNVCVLCMKIVAIVFVWFTAVVAIKQGPKDLSAWKDVIPSIILFIGPDWLSKFIYNEEADNQFIDQCVERAIKEMKQTPAQQNEEGLTINLSGKNPTVSPGTPNVEEQTPAQSKEEGLTTNLSGENPGTPNEEESVH